MKTVDNVATLSEKPKAELHITREADHFKCKLIIPNVDQSGYGESPGLALEDALEMLAAEFKRLEDELMELYEC